MDRVWMCRIGKMKLALLLHVNVMNVATGSKNHMFGIMISYRTIVAFLLLINRVSLQVVDVVDVVGGSVDLPCSSKNNKHNLDDINVRWRHNGSKNVYDIIKGIGSVERQDPVYMNRIKTFPGEYEKGNFTLKLNNLRHTDAGEYLCYITHSSELRKVQLLINESTTQAGQVTRQEDQAAEKKIQAAASVIGSAYPFLCLVSPCRTAGHYYFPYFSRLVERREDVERHLLLCYNQMTSQSNDLTVYGASPASRLNISGA
ncbi:hypothetical protein E1301_Tti018233 [Triplophysa tibetana]|uniref:Ig-like domain-containing protein n=1 Tax=Triplophysa tibetana TaxID=1572043 RepID=A0A5A9NU01_9TELE|nr:hypothetical protein E1301_Tti018233 [Triplophysa tibetana]